MSTNEEDYEERVMEIEALESIFENDFRRRNEFVYMINISPEADKAFVSLSLEIEVDECYPSKNRPRFKVLEAKGLAKNHLNQIEEVAISTATENEGMVCVFDVATAVKEWLNDHNVAGQDDDSMYAAMLRRREEEEKKNSHKNNESQLNQEDAIEAAREERLRNGTPFSLDRFYAWSASFQAECALAKLYAHSSADQQKDESRSTRLTGKDLFTHGNAKQIQDDADNNYDDDSASSAEYDYPDNIPGASDIPIDETLFEGDDGDLGDLDDDDEEDDAT